MESITLKATPATLRALRLVAAMTGEKQYRVLERVVLMELDRQQALANLQARDSVAVIGERLTP